MRLRLTVAHGIDGPELGRGPRLHEVEVEAPCGSSAADLAEALAAHVDDLTADQLNVDGRPVPPETPVGCPPLIDGAAVALLAQLAPVRRPKAAVPALWLVVSHGPDAGHAHALAVGRHTVGRSAEADLSLGDPRLSRLHLEVVVEAEAIMVRDLHSTNGTQVDGTPLGSDARRVTMGSTITLGATELSVRDRAVLPAATTSRPDGTRAVNRRPRTPAAAAPRPIEVPTPPSPPRPARIPWVAILLPIPVAAVLAVLAGPTMIAFALLSPLIAGGTAATDRISGRKRYAEALAEYERRLGGARDSIDAACREEREQRRRSFPDPAEVLSIAAGPRGDLWQKRPGDDDALKVSVGTCTAQSAIELECGTGPHAVETPTLARVPCVVSLEAVRVLGVCGERETVMGAARALLGQLLVLHSPRDLRLVVITADPQGADDWSWLARTPHLRRPDGSTPSGSLACLYRDPEHARAAVRALTAEAECRARPGGRAGGPRAQPALLVVLDGAAALRSCPGTAALLEAGSDTGVCCLALDRSRARLPAEAGAVLDLADSAQPALDVTDGVRDDLAVDRVGDWWADRLSRSLAQLRDASFDEEAASVPGVVAFDDLVPEADEPEKIVELWHRWVAGVSAPVGRTSDGTFAIDLSRDGPHLLVGGTTGSGKSELLRTLVLSLAIHHPPDRLSMVLIDYKGGAAFRDCSRLPHTAGVVTDLDGHLADRALVSLHAEVARRERVLAGVGAPDYDALLATAPGIVLPRLVIVIDEFRMLVEELPAFVDGVVRLAALGRSLGIHVVLATQRPSGVVSADIKANVNLRIALRMRDRVDSDDVVGAPAAAELDPDQPGRAVARCGNGELVEFQTAHLSAPSLTTRPAGIRVRSADWETVTAPWPAPPPQGPMADGLTRSVEAVVAAANLTSATPAAPPWLPPLPASLDPCALPAPRTDWELPIGLADHPSRQAQESVVLDLATPGHWCLVGAVGSGRTTALRNIARGLASQRDATRLHLYAVSNGTLHELQDLPQCGAHVTFDDLPRLDRLAARLVEETARRRAGLAASGHPSMSAWWGADEATAPPPIVILLDDWDQLVSHPLGSGEDALVQQLVALLREGDGVGIKAVAAAGRSLLLGPSAGLFGRRLLFRPADPTDWLVAGLGPRHVPSHLPPGRALLVDGTEVQLAVPTDRPPRRVRLPGGCLPLRVDPLPTLVREDAGQPARPATGDILVGIGGDACEPQHLNEERDGHRWLVAGAAESGVSTTLLVLARALIRQGRAVAVVAAGRGPLEALRADPRLVLWSTPDDADALIAARRDHRDLAVIVDDAHQLDGTPSDAVLRELSAGVDNAAGLLVCGANSTMLSTLYRGVVVEVARHQTGILLGPRSATDGELLGRRLRTDAGAPPGRGYLVRRGIPTRLQVVLPDHASPPPVGTPVPEGPFETSTRV
jgi:S-DNA-T family DNA segregation ATPase FtsK/SpoIIIE